MVFIAAIVPDDVFWIKREAHRIALPVIRRKARADESLKEVRSDYERADDESRGGELTEPSDRLALHLLFKRAKLRREKEYRSEHHYDRPEHYLRPKISMDTENRQSKALI